MDTNSGTKENTTTGAAASASSTLSGLSSEFSTTLAAADTSAAQGIQALQQVHQARLSLLTRTAARSRRNTGPTTQGEGRSNGGNSHYCDRGTHCNGEPTARHDSPAGLRERMGALRQRYR